MDFAGRRRAVAPCASVLLLRRVLREVYRSLCTNRHASPRQSGLLFVITEGVYVARSARFVGRQDPKIVPRAGVKSCRTM